MVKGKKIVAITTTIFSVLTLAFINLTGATPPNFVIKIENPADSSITQASSVILSFSITNNGEYAEVESIEANCYLDGQFYSQPQIGFGDINNPHIASTKGQLSLASLSQGEHKVEIRVRVAGYGVLDSFDWDLTPATEYFFVGAYGKPSVSIISQDKYNVNEASIKITTDVHNSVISYILDGKDKVIIPEATFKVYQPLYQYNITLTNLFAGSHTFTAYAKDKLGNTGLAEKDFIINTATPTPTSSSGNQPFWSNSIFVIALTTAIVAFAVIGLTLLLLQAKHKTTQKKEKAESTQTSPKPTSP